SLISLTSRRAKRLASLCNFSSSGVIAAGVSAGAGAGVWASAKAKSETCGSGVAGATLAGDAEKASDAGGTSAEVISNAGNSGAGASKVFIGTDDGVSGTAAGGAKALTAGAESPQDDDGVAVKAGSGTGFSCAFAGSTCSTGASP